MRKSAFLYPLLLSALFISSCGLKTTNVKTPPAPPPPPPSILMVDQQIAEYIRNIYQDKNGHFWLGTNGHGVAHYNGKVVNYFSNVDGFDGQQITGISEDRDKNIWFATDQGVVSYQWNNNDGQKQFTNYSDNKYFEGQRFWSIHADSKGIIWAGAERGIYRFDGETWKAFDLPYPEKSTGRFITAATSWSITEDSKGNIWFSTNGYGAYKYNGKTFTQLTKEDGLTDNSVDNIHGGQQRQHMVRHKNWWREHV